MPAAGAMSPKEGLGLLFVIGIERTPKLNAFWGIIIKNKTKIDDGAEETCVLECGITSLSWVPGSSYTAVQK